MKILLCAAEVAPFAKAGGLGDVAAALPKAWETLGHKPVVMLPKYGNIDTAKYGIEPTQVVISVPVGTWVEYARLWIGKFPGTSVPVYFIQNADYFDRPGIYGNPDGFSDNDRRFLFFSRAVFEAAKALGFQPDIIHAHDNHTGFVPALLASFYRREPFFARTASVFTIHNMAYQGVYEPRRAMELSGFGMRSFYRGSWFEHNNVVNSMKAGIMFAEKITTVSPTYAEEIRWTENGEGLQTALESRAADLLGVLNGVDYTEWNPEIDTDIPLTYTPETISRKEMGKAQFLMKRGLTEKEARQPVPLLGMVSRLTAQKGVEMMQKTLEDFLAKGQLRVALLGSGEKRYEDFFRYIARKFPRRAFITIGYDNPLSHSIIAASDFLALPSMFEPCGLTQMYALKYGTVPIVRATGGLADTVEEYDAVTMRGTGFLFDSFNRREFYNAVQRALISYRFQPHWDRIRQNGMAKNFSSEVSAAQYINIFTWALQKIGVLGVE